MLAAAIDHIETRAESEEFLMLYAEQANLFSAVVGVLGTLALDTVSSYEKNPNRFIASQRFPDLIRRGTHAGPVPPTHALEIKASKRPNAVDAHYNHEGWYLVFRYLVDLTKRTGRSVVIWRVDCAYLRKADWTYGKSKAGQINPAGEEEGGRTHTFSVKNPATVFANPIFVRSDVGLVDQKPVFSGP